MDNILELLKIVGPVGALIIFFIYRDWRERRQEKKEDELIKRLNKVEDYQKEKLEGLVIETSKAIKANTDSTKALVQALNLRPCINGKVTEGS